MQLLIDSEFSALLPAQTPETYALIEAGLLEAGGCPDKIVVWAGHNIVLEGHTRYEVCEKHGLPYKTREVKLADRDACRRWIIRWQLSRRNLTDEQRAYYRGMEYLEAKKPTGNPQFPHCEGIGGETAEDLAKKHDIGRATIERDGAYAAAVETIKNANPAVAEKILSGTSGSTRLAVLSLADKLAGHCQRCQRFIASGADPVFMCPQCKETPKPKKAAGKRRSGKPKAEKPIVIIPERLKPVFDCVDDFARASSLATKLGNLLVTIEAGPAYKAIYPPGMKQTVHSFALLELATKLRRMRPKQPCFHCEGKREAGEDDAACTACKGKGYQTEQDAALAKKAAALNGGG